MNAQDYLLYSVKITPDGEFYMIEIDGEGWEGALSQGKTIEEAKKMAEFLIYDYLEGFIELKRKIPAPTVVTENRHIVNIGYDTALKVMIRNIMYDKQIKQAELARRMNIKPQLLNNILNLRKETSINRIVQCFQALQNKLIIEVNDE